jgi:tripartite-type tricarboxylate transporter receptor subunit TctC
MNLPRSVRARLAVWLFLAGPMLPGVGPVQAQAWPVKPIRIVTSGVGGGSDLASRLVAQGISPALGQQVIVDNRPSGVIPGEVVAKAAPDGYTLLVSSSVLWLEPLFQGQAPYDAARDFAPVSLIAKSPNILVVHPSLPVKSVKELVALAKARPGELNYAAGATGSSDHLAAELFKVMSGVNIVRISYKTAASRVADLMGGHVHLSFGSGGTVVVHVRSGRLRALAVTSAEPSALLPELPTVAASGVPGYEAIQILAVFAPARTPAPLIGRLNQEIARAVNRADVKEKFLSSGVETVGSSPEHLAAAIKSDMAKWEKLVKVAGIRAE